MKYTARMRKAEEEIDTFLNGVRGAAPINIFNELLTASS